MILIALWPEQTFVSYGNEKKKKGPAVITILFSSGEAKGDAGPHFPLILNSAR